MRTCSLFVAAACMLAAPFASAGRCPGLDKVNVTASRADIAGPGGFISTGAQLASELEGTYALSNGVRMEVILLDQRIYAEWGKWSRVELEEVGPHQLASPEGDVHLTYMPNKKNGSIVMSYPADKKGRLKRYCS